MTTGLPERLRNLIATWRARAECGNVVRAWAFNEAAVELESLIAMHEADGCAGCASLRAELAEASGRNTMIALAARIEFLGFEARERSEDYDRRQVPHAGAYEAGNAEGLLKAAKIIKEAICAQVADNRTCGCRGTPNQVCDICQGIGPDGLGPDNNCNSAGSAAKGEAQVRKDVSTDQSSDVPGIRTAGPAAGKSESAGSFSESGSARSCDGGTPVSPPGSEDEREALPSSPVRFGLQNAKRQCASGRIQYANEALCEHADQA